MMEFTPEMIEMAKSAASPEELAALANEHNLPLTDSEAAMYFDQLNPKMGALEDDELEMVSGGACGKSASVSEKVYGGFLKFPSRTYVKGPVCTNCRNYATKHFNYDYNLAWFDSSHTQFRLYCISCGYQWEAGAFRGDPRPHGIQPV